MQVLHEPLEVRKEEGFVLLDRPAQGGAKLIALEQWSGALVEVVGSIQGIVAQILIHRTMQLVGARLGHDDHLSPRPFAVLGAVGVAQHVELAHCFDTDQVPARTTRLHVVFRRAGELHAIEQEKVLLWAIARDREIVAGRGIRNSDAAGFLPGEIHDARIERKQKIIAPAIQRQGFYFFLSDQTRDVLRGRVDECNVRLHLHLLGDLADFQAEVGRGILAHD